MSKFVVEEQIFKEKIHIPDGRNVIKEFDTFFDAFCFWNKIDKNDIKPNAQISIMEVGYPLIIKSKTRNNVLI